VDTGLSASFVEHALYGGLSKKEITETLTSGGKDPHDARELIRGIETKIAYGTSPSKTLVSSVGLVRALIIGAFILAIFFLSTNITGNAIGTLSKNSTNWIGGILIFLAIAMGFFLFQRKTLKVKKTKHKVRKKLNLFLS